MTTRIHLIEDDAAVRRGLLDLLTMAGHRVDASEDGERGLRAAIAGEHDLVLLDLMLPQRDGFAVLSELRARKPALPVIVVTARGAEEERVRGLLGGADDYVVKPFGPSELLARIEAVLRRAPRKDASFGTVRVDDLEIDFDRRELRMAGGGRVELSEKEAELLRYLAGHRGRAVSRREILDAVWGLDPRGLRTRAIDMHVARLRERSGRPGLILTVRARGYKLGGDA